MTCLLLCSSAFFYLFSSCFAFFFFFFSSRRRHTSCLSDWSSDVCSSDLSGATLDLNGLRFTQSGGNLTNDGTITASAAAGNEIQFLGTATPQAYSGSGSVPSPLPLFSVDNPAGVTLSPSLAANIVVRRVRLVRGLLSNSHKLTLGHADASTASTQVGAVGVTGAAGAYDASPVFNPGSGGVSVSYLQEGVARTTGFEIPASRQLRDLTVDRAGGLVIVSGGPLALTSGLTLTAGILRTSASDLVVIGDTASSIPDGSAQAHVDGPLALAIRTTDTVGVTRTFAVGRDGAFRPLTLSGVLTGGVQQVVTAEVLAGPTGGSPTPPLQSLAAARYWRLSNSAGLNPQARVRLSFGTDDLVGDLANLRVAQSSSSGGSYAGLGGTATGSPSSGSVLSTADLAPGSDYFVVASAGALAKVWDGGAATSSWGDAANWSPDGVPDSTTDVTLSFAVPTTVHLAGDFAVRNLTVNSNATLLLDSGTLAVRNDYSQTSGTVQLATAALAVSRYTSLTGGALDVGPGMLATHDFVSVTGGSLSLSSGSMVADSTLAIEGGTVQLGTGVLELKGSFWRTSGSFLAGTGTTIFSGTATQYIGGAVTYHNLVLRNGGAGSPKQLQSFLPHIINNDFTVESTALMDLSSATATQLTVWGNFFYSGLTGGTAIGNLTINLAGLGKTFSGVPSSAPAFGRVEGEEAPAPDVPTVETDLRTDPATGQWRSEEHDGKPVLVLENTYEKRKGQVEQLLRSADPSKRLVINLDDMTLVRNPETPASLAASAVTPGSADAAATTKIGRAHV